MGLEEKIAVAAVCLFLLLVVSRLFPKPFHWTGRLILRSSLGLGALYLLRLLSPWVNISVGLNLWNALAIGVLGFPGMVLLVLLCIVFV